MNEREKYVEPMTAGDFVKGIFLLMLACTPIGLILIPLLMWLDER